MFVTVNYNKGIFVLFPFLICRDNRKEARPMKINVRLNKFCMFLRNMHVS